MQTPSYAFAFLPEGVGETIGFLGGVRWEGGVSFAQVSPCLLPRLFVSVEPADFRRKGVLSQSLASPVHSSG